MMARAHIALLPYGHHIAARQDAAHARAVLLKAGLEVAPHASGGELRGEIAALLQTAQAVRGLARARGLGRLTTLVKLGVS